MFRTPRGADSVRWRADSMGIRRVVGLLIIKLFIKVSTLGQGEKAVRDQYC